MATNYSAGYFKNKTVANIRSRFSDSPSWKAIMKVKETYMAGRAVNINSGNLARVWHDPWIDAAPLRETFPILFSICQDQDGTIADFVAKNYSLGFRRRLFGEINDQWEWVVSEAKKYTLNDILDTVFWKLCRNKRLTTKSVYNWLERDLAGPNYKWIWKTSIPLKIKIFLWQLFQNDVLTRDNLRKRKWPGNPVCSFCTNMETANHLFFTCPLARTIWGGPGTYGWSILLPAFPLAKLGVVV